MQSRPKTICDVSGITKERMRRINEVGHTIEDMINTKINAEGEISNVDIFEAMMEMDLSALNKAECMLLSWHLCQSTLTCYYKQQEHIKMHARGTGA